MCGICGAVAYQDSGFLDPVAGMVALMKRRGPDDEGIWTDYACCALGFRRLAIQDLSPAGHQPMLTADRRFAIVFNGEVYNFGELRRELRATGVNFRSTGDTEVVLYALAHWGRQALNRFNGMFALALYDVRTRTLLLARDHAGIKPLYYMHTKEGFAFASQYDQLLAHPASRNLAVDHGAVGLYLRLGYIPAPYALLQSTHMLEPGSWLQVGVDKLEQGRYFEFPRFPEPVIAAHEAHEAVDAAVTNAVRRQLVSDVPVGTFLSGGIDSPLVTAKVAAATNGALSAFTIGTAGDRHDESADAMKYARELGVPHIVEHVSPATSIALLDDVIAACGEPFGDFSIFPTMLVSRLARQHATVMLSGDGGDELFWGYTKRVPAVLAGAPDFRWPLWLRYCRAAGERLAGKPGNPHLPFSTLGRWYREKHSHLHEQVLANIFDGVPEWPQGYRQYDYDGYDVDETAHWLRWNEFTGRMNMILLKVDRASMHESLEVRVPLLDREVVDTALKIDWRACLDLERRLGKLPLRAALSRHVGHRTEAKRGFTVPMADWLRGPLKARFMDTVIGRSDLLGMPIRRGGLERHFERFLQGRAHDAWGLWILFALALWTERYYNNSRPPTARSTLRVGCR